jgi:hypothetical protein
MRATAVARGPPIRPMRTVEDKARASKLRSQARPPDPHELPVRVKTHAYPMILCIADAHVWVRLIQILSPDKPEY